MKKYTWEDLQEHNTEEKGIWIAIDSKVYDITKFLPNHPGGSQLLKISAGRDCTDLFKSYHSFTNKPGDILPKYQIGVLEGTYDLNRFAPDTGFYKECCERVGEYFKTNNLHPKAPWSGLWRLALFMSLLVWSYLIMWQIIPANIYVQYFSIFVYAIAQSMCLLHQMHDACHAAIGYNQTWWNVMNRLTMEWIGGGAVMSWYHQHVLGHHIYTNIMGSDPDMPFLSEGDLRFLVKQQKWKSLYKYQHIYMPILYGGLSLKFRIQDFTWTFGSEKNGHIPVNPLSKAEWAHFLLTKSFFAFYRILAPIIFFGFPATTVLAYFFIIELITGYWLAFNFQVSHISTEALFPCEVKYEPHLAKEWAVIQVLTSVDYGHHSFLQTFLSGALNYQTVHHLFPGISQYHYPAIAPIVKDVCKKYKLPFNELPGFYEAFSAHLSYLKEMGKSESELK
jgi:fatty acid desaturase/predicted heme/steroid binding protein